MRHSLNHRAFVWEGALAAGWRLTGWVLERASQQHVARRVMRDPVWEIDTGRFDRVVATLSLAILEQAWLEDASPPQVSLRDLAGQLDQLPHRRDLQRPESKPLHYLDDDLWPLIASAGPGELTEWADIAGAVVAAHVVIAHRHGSASQPPTIADRLPDCPTPLGADTLLSSPSRRHTTEQKLRISTPARRLRVGGQLTVTPTPDAAPQLITCPWCDADRSLTLTCGPEDARENPGGPVTMQCPNHHTWRAPPGITTGTVGAIINDNPSPDLRIETP